METAILFMCVIFKYISRPDLLESCGGFDLFLSTFSGLFWNPHGSAVKASPSPPAALLLHLRSSGLTNSPQQEGEDEEEEEGTSQVWGSSSFAPAAVHTHTCCITAIPQILVHHSLGPSP